MVGEERAGFSAMVYSLFCCFCSLRVFLLALGVWERLHFLLRHSLGLPLAISDVLCIGMTQIC